MVNDSVPFVPTRDDLIGYISDTHKEINGFRPRPNWSELSYEQLDRWGRSLAADAVTYRKQEVVRNRIARGLRRAVVRAGHRTSRSRARRAGPAGGARAAAVIGRRRRRHHADAFVHR